LAQEQADLNSTLDQLNEEIEDAKSAGEARRQEKAAREIALSEKQSTHNGLIEAIQALEAEVTQSQIRNAALGEKRENTHHNLENRLKLREEAAAQIEARKARIAEVIERRTEIEKALAGAEEKLAAERAALRELEEQLQAERQRYRNISMSLAEIDEAIKELRPLSEACQETRNQLQLQLSEKRMSYQHLADNLREKYDVDLTELVVSFEENVPVREELLAEIDDLRGRLDRMGEVNLAAI